MFPIKRDEISIAALSYGNMAGLGRSSGHELIDKPFFSLQSDWRLLLLLTP